MFSWKPPDDLGVRDGLLAACKSSPNCVSSQANPADREHYIAPFHAGGEPMAAVRKAVESLPRTKIIRQDKNYLYAEFRSKLLGYVDDVEFFFDGNAVHVRSCSRLGRRDFGVNRKRVEALRALIETRR